MFNRLLGAGIAVTTTVASTVAFSIAPAIADPANAPVAADIVGVGSDTSQFALDYLADGKTINGSPVPGYNQKSGVTHFLRTFHADGDPATIVLQQSHAAVTRPNGSGAGMALLYGAGNNTDVDFARSSSAIDANGQSAGLEMYPFALDTLRTAVSNNSNAPANLTINQLVSIYHGDATDWSQVDPLASGTIKPLIPQAGSGTRKFFEAQLKAANGGIPVALAPSVQETQEHSDTDVKNDPNAIAPFSAGRAQLLGTVHLEGGFSANRALYNVVRGASVSDPDIQAIFGDTGFLCSPAATTLISAAGFTQLATNGGDCGIPTQTPTSNFQTSGTALTTTTLAGTQPSAGSVHLDATVTGGASPAGTVTFTEGATTLGGGPVALTSGHAVLDLSGVSLGSHTYQASFAPTDSAEYKASSATRVVQVRNPSTVAVSVTPASGTYGHARSAVINVTSAGGTPSGNVTVRVLSWSATKALSAGGATVPLPINAGAGTQKVTVSYAGSPTFATSSTSKTYVIAKSAVALSESFPASVAKGKRAVGSVRVALSPASSVIAAGSFTIKRGTRLLASGTLSNGARALTLPALPRGNNNLVLFYGGNASTLSRSLSFLIVQK